MKRILGWILFVVLLVTCIGTDYKEAYYDQIIDHFNFRSLGSQTYKQRYIYNDTWWEKERGPIFFYVGNEVPIDKKWNDDRFVMEIAPTHKAFVLFVEHRYRGKSLPFGDDSFEPSNIGWLSIEQTLADYAFFLENFKKKFNAQNCPVIGFGASYGAMLAAFMRFKYPNVIQGAVASSGPIFQLEGKTKSDLYFQAATETFRRQSADCEARVRAGYQEMNKWVSNGNLAQELSNNVQQAGKSSRGIWPDFPDIGDSPENKKRKGLKRISKAFRLCNRMKTDTDYDRFLRWTRNGLVDAAQKDHPFPTDTYPAFPVKVMCERLKEESSPVEGLRSAIDLFYNATGTVKCYDVERDFIYCGVSQGCAPGVISTAWDYQACTQNNLEGGSNGETDMFPVLPFTADMRDEHCKQKWNVTPRRDWLQTVYWGEDIGLSSNIVFSNGNLDPWTPGGVLKNVSDTVRAIIIDGAAHHLDFWASHPNDPQTVIDARNFEVTNIQKWIRDYHEARERIQRK